MNFRDYDRKFWLVVEKPNSLIRNLIFDIKGNALLCCSYFHIEKGIVFEALSPATFINGDYSLNGNVLWDNHDRHIFNKKQLDGYELIPVNNDAIKHDFLGFIIMIEDQNYIFRDLTQTRDMLFLDEFRQEDNPDILKGAIFDTEFIENVWLKIRGLKQAIDENTYLFYCEIMSEPFIAKGIHNGDRTFCFVKQEGNKKVCGCYIGAQTIEDLRKKIKLI